MDDLELKQILRKAYSMIVISCKVARVRVRLLWTRFNSIMIDHEVQCRA